jgi:tRNA dimethylallyltransferase
MAERSSMHTENSSVHPPLVAIVGPTASGKSTLAVSLAEKLGGEILACDSTQLYRGFDIGTAKPTPAERRNISHHLIDVLDPSQASTAGGYREMAIEALNLLRLRHRLPILTAGTGLYLRALVDGLADLPQRSEDLRERLRQGRDAHPPGHLHRILRRLDPASAQKISAGDEQKLIRAIEICLIAQRPLSEVHQTARTPLQNWRVMKIGLNPPREALYERIHARTDAMLAAGWLDEVRDLLSSGAPENAKPFEFIGYRELRAVLRNETSLEAARSLIQQSTRRYAKRQLTWFRREHGVYWIESFGDFPEAQQQALVWIRAQL